MDRHHRMEWLVTWLSFMPPIGDIARFLVLGYLSPYKPVKCLMWHLNKVDSLILLSSYGDDGVSMGKFIPGSVWRMSSEEFPLVLQTTPNKPISWLDQNRQAVINLYAQSMLIGFLSISFVEPMDDLEDFILSAKELSWLISLYLALQSHQFIDLKVEVPSVNGTCSRDPVKMKIELSQRQASILSSIVAKKTNHEISKELGFSVSTIRHETMRIFEVLGVCNRFEAASYATTLGLI